MLNHSNPTEMPRRESIPEVEGPRVPLDYRIRTMASCCSGRLLKCTPLKKHINIRSLHFYDTFIYSYNTPHSFIPKTTTPSSFNLFDSTINPTSNTRHSTNSPPHIPTKTKYKLYRTSKLFYFIFFQAVLIIIHIIIIRTTLIRNNSLKMDKKIVF